MKARGRGDRATLLRFAAVGASGVAVNLAALHALAAIAGLPEVLASALAIEASVLWNFAWNDGVTFRDRRAGARLLPRLARYHAVCAAGTGVQLATFAVAVLLLARAGGGPDAGALRYPAQLLGIALGFAANWVGSSRFAWRAPADPSEGAPRRALLAPAIFALLVVAHAVPIWAVPYFPTQDGPLHVENVLALLRHGEDPFLRAWYLPNLGAQPNWLTQALLAGLLRFASPLAAEKLVLTGYVVLLPLAFRAALPAGARGWWAALGVFPFVHSYPFHMGFWNFLYGLAIAFLAVAVAFRWRARRSPWHLAALAGLGLLLFLAHSVAFAGALVAGGAVLSWRAGLALARARRHPARFARLARGHARRLAVTAAAAAPGLVLLAVWVLAHRDRAAARIPLPELLAKLGSLYALVAIDRREIPLALAAALAIGVAVVHLLLARAGGRKARPHDGWLVAAGLFALLYVAVPDVAASGAHISDRLALLAFLSLVAWVAWSAGPRAASPRLGAALAAVALVALGVRAEKQRELSGYLEEYVSAAPAITPGRALLPLALQPHGPRDDAGRRLGYRVKPFLHATGWIVAERGGVDLKNSQAHTDHCPVRFVDGRDPFRTVAGSLGRMEGVPPCVDLGRAQEVQVDYVLLWGATRTLLDTPCGGALARGLAEGWEPLFLSEPRGMLQVWARRPGATAAAKPSGPVRAAAR
jgi:putative flippase GtrA